MISKKIIITWVRNFKIGLFFAAWLSFFSCNESPHIDFHSYEELSNYEFIQNGWFPEILNHDASDIRETYDVNNKHLFGKFDFKNRINYDSIVAGYSVVEKDSLIKRIKEIKRPRRPEWFIHPKDLTDNNFVFTVHNNFYLIIEKEKNRIYFLR